MRVEAFLLRIFKESAVKLEDLVGHPRHLSGVDFSMFNVPRYDYEDGYDDVLDPCNTCSFILDGQVYTCVEDPDDGYRSHLKLIFKGSIAVANVFMPQEVRCAMRNNSKVDPDDYDYERGVILDMIDTTTGKTILSVGTSNTDDYYPSYVARFDPTAMAINQE